MTPKSARVILPEGDWLKQVSDIFSRSEPVALPTETVYGLAALVSDKKAIARIYEIKNRPQFNPLIVHVKEDWKLSEWATIGKLERKLISEFWPGPLSLLLPKKNISDLITAGSDKVVLRAPSHPLFRELLDYLKTPLVAPSANPSTKLSATTAKAVLEGLSPRGLQAVVQGGACKIGIESTIVQVVDEVLVIMREGALSQEDLVARGYKVKSRAQMESDQKAMETPGQMLKHYSPGIPLLFFEKSKEWLDTKKTEGILFLKILESDAKTDEIENLHIESLAPDDDLKTAAARLFEFLRNAQIQYESMRVLKTKDVGLGRAINDRLLRASREG